MIGSGDQYLEMDDALWRDPGLPEALATWLTLGLSTKVHEQTGDRLEAWMAAPLGKWQFVGRLTAFGRDDHNRPNYFAHGRAWQEDEWRDPADDPGALFGHPSAFDVPRLVQHGISFETVSDWSSYIVSGFEKLSEGKHAESAAQLVAHLFQAVETGPPVVCVANVEDFFSNAVLATLIGIARAALPIEVRKKVKIRLYAEHPQAFIDSGVHLLAVLHNFAAHTTGVNRTVLHFDDGAIAGPAAATVYDEYGRAVISRAKKHPRDLLRFGASSGRRLRTALAGDAPIEGSLHVAFDIVRAAGFDNAAYDSLLKKRLFPAALGRHQRLAWKELLDTSDWEAFSDDALTDIAVLDAPSADALLLREQVRSELSKRTRLIDDLLERNWKPTIEHAIDVIIWTFSGDRRPFSLDTVARLLHQLSPAVARRLLLDDQCHAQFAELAGRAPLPDEWHELLEVPADDARRMLCAVARRKSPNYWRPWIDSWVVIIAGGAITDDVVDAVVAVGATTDNLLVAAAYGDVLSSRAAEREAAEQLGKQLRITYAQEQWQALVRQCAERASLFLERYAPLKWLLHYATVEDVATLASIVDAHIQKAPAEGCGDLIRVDRFCAWLAASTNTTLRRRAALEWLRSAEVSDPLRDWTTIMDALETSLTGAQLLVPTRIPPQAALHRVPLDIRLTLAKHAADLGAVLVLAQTASPPAYEQAEMIGRERPDLWRDLPQGVLRIVAGEDGAPALAGTAQLEELVGRSGHRSSFVLEAALGKFLLSAAQGHAPLQTASPEFWAAGRVCKVVRQWVDKHATRPADELAALLDWLPAETQAAINDVPAVWRARHIGPELDPGPAGDKSLKTAIAAAGNALANRTMDEPAWAEIARACAHSQLGRNPVVLIGDNVVADRARHESYMRHGAAVLERAVHTNPGLMEISFTFRDPLPLFTLLVRTSPGLTLSEAALRLIDWRLAQRSESAWPAWLASLVCGIRGSTRLSGARGPDDSADVALARVVRALLHSGYPDEVRLGMLAHVHPLPSERR